MADRLPFQDRQYAFAAHLRDPEHVPAPPGIEDRRMKIYRDLFFNNLSNLLGTMFPVLRRIHDDAAWRRMIRQFMQRHRAETPYFLELPEEFLAFLQDEFEPGNSDFPFLAELAHYEYVELALSVSTEKNDCEDVEPDADLLGNTPVKSKLAWAFAYHYPVHRIAPDFLPETASDEAVYLAVYRGGDDVVRFMELNAVTAALLDAIDNNERGLSGAALLRELAVTIGFSDIDALMRHGRAALEEMRKLGILTGARKPALGVHS